MEITNKHNFPHYVVEWLKNDQYDYQPDVLSATTLMQPPRMYALKKIHKDQITMDVSDLIALRYGTAIHDSVEKVKISNAIQEKRLFHTMISKQISGKFDMLVKLDEETWKLVDIKSTSVWNYIYGSNDEEYKKQLSIYRYLAYCNNLNVSDNAEIMMVFTDWSRKRSLESQDYPETRIKIKSIKLMSIEDTEKYIVERIQLLESTAALLEQDKMPECTEKELWAGKSTFIIKEKQVKLGSSDDINKNPHVLRKFKTFEDAEGYREGISEGMDRFVVVEIKGKVNRCDYCQVKPFCNQAKKLQEEGRV